MLHQFSSPESSNISGATYDSESQMLTIDFSSGRSYQYTGVPLALWEDFAAAVSKGHYFNHQIRPLYSGAQAAPRGPV